MVQRAYALKAKRTVFAACIAFIVALTLALTPSAWADPVAEKQAEAQAALQSLNTMLAELDEANNAYAAAVGEQEQAKNLVRQTQTQIDEQTSIIEDLQNQLSTRVRSMYRTGASSFLDVLFGSTTPGFADQGGTRQARQAAHYAVAATAGSGGSYQGS